MSAGRLASEAAVPEGPLGAGGDTRGAATTVPGHAAPGQPGFQLLLSSAWINACLGLKDTDSTIQPASARGDELWPPSADVLTVRTGHTFMAERDEVIRQTAHFLAHGRFARPPWSDQ